MNTAIIKPQWGPLTIALMVLGFIVFWPLGLAMLAYILWGEMFGGSAEKAAGFVNRAKAWTSENCGPRGSHFRGNWRPSSGNAAFDEYRAETLRRLEDEQREFQEFLARLREAKDKAEFDQFMAERRGRHDVTPPSPQSPQT